MESLIYARLSGDPTLTALCPTLTPDVPTVNTELPFIVYYVSGTEPQIHLGGVSSLTEYQMTIEVIAKYFDAANTIANRVAVLLHGYRSMPDIQGCFLTARESVPEDDADQFSHISMQFKIFAT